MMTMIGADFQQHRQLRLVELIQHASAAPAQFGGQSMRHSVAWVVDLDGHALGLQAWADPSVITDRHVWLASRPRSFDTDAELVRGTADLWLAVGLIEHRSIERPVLPLGCLGHGRCSGRVGRATWNRHGILRRGLSPRTPPPHPLRTPPLPLSGDRRAGERPPSAPAMRISPVPAPARGLRRCSEAGGQAPDEARRLSRPAPAHRSGGPRRSRRPARGRG